MEDWIKRESVRQDLEGKCERLRRNGGDVSKHWGDIEYFLKINWKQ